MDEPGLIGQAIRGALFCFALGLPSSALGQASGSPAVLDTRNPVTVKSSPARPARLARFDGFVQTANTAQITLRARNNPSSIQTFSLTQAASEKMQKIVDAGGFQYGDRVTVYFDPATRRAARFKGKPSKPI